MNQSTSNLGSLQELYEELYNYGWRIEGGLQHDSHEMLSTVFSTILTELLAIEKNMGVSEKMSHLRGDIVASPSRTNLFTPSSLFDVSWILANINESSTNSPVNSEEIFNNNLKQKKVSLRDKLKQLKTCREINIPILRLQSGHFPSRGSYANQLRCFTCGTKVHCVT